MIQVKIGAGAVLAGIAMFTGGLQSAWGQCTTPGTLRKVDLATTLNKPDHMSVLPDGRVFASEMWSGKVKLYTPGTNAVTEVLATPASFYPDGTENGFLGIAADPKFSTNSWVYVFYSRKTGVAGTYSAGDGTISYHEHVLARYTFANGKLGNAKELLKVPRLSKRHSAGGMTFNKLTGDLYLTTGDDSYPSSDLTKWGGRQENNEALSSLRTAANTNDLRGKTLRIRPIAFPDTETPAIGVDKTYSIPAGNLFPIGTAKTLPEIYTMGHRNPYKIKVDDLSGFALIGEVGPDAGGDDANKGPVGYEEFNLIQNKPGNYGWPFGVANNLMYTAISGEAYPVGTKFDANNLKNLSKLNTGIEQLPPSIPAIAYYSLKSIAAGSVFKPFDPPDGETAIAGPYYRYDAQPEASTVKLPGFFHGKFIVADWSRGKIWALELSSTYAVTKVTEIRTAYKPIDLDIGPNGELYVLEYSGPGDDPYQGADNSGKLYKLEYSGTQYALSGCPQSVIPKAGPSALVNSGRSGSAETRLRLVNLSVMKQVRAPAGMGKAVLYDLKGGRIGESAVRDGMATLSASTRNSLAYLQFE